MEIPEGQLIFHHSNQILYYMLFSPTTLYTTVDVHYSSNLNTLDNPNGT